MKKGLFLPLDSYMENAQHMEFDKLDQKVMEAGRNEQGEINAPIETWCVVNANTQHPEDAFFLVDCLLSKEFLSQEDFWTKVSSAPASMTRCPFSGWPGRTVFRCTRDF